MSFELVLDLSQGVRWGPVLLGANPAGATIDLDCYCLSVYLERFCDGTESNALDASVRLTLTFVYGLFGALATYF